MGELDTNTHMIGLENEHCKRNIPVVEYRACVRTSRLLLFYAFYLRDVQPVILVVHCHLNVLPVLMIRLPGLCLIPARWNYWVTFGSEEEGEWWELVCFGITS